ncbi:hypothetical protein [Pseudomonas sp. CGJS7]|uniref:hypothetical protein n=1 Tax=Pseudomonas sp. CGJS7 TaxID=3109348 RepID=UPI0030098659
MSSEFYVVFDDPEWLPAHRAELAAAIQRLATYVRDDGPVFWLLGSEDRDADGRWAFDVRIFTEWESGSLLIELTLATPSIGADLRHWLAWLRAQTAIAVVDEDGEAVAGWL